jgi:excisionase family DNA binding protein
MNNLSITVPGIDKICELLEQIKNQNALRGTLATASEWLRTEEALNILGVSKKTLYLMRTRGEIGFSKVGKRIYYKRADIEKLIRQDYEPSFDARGEDRIVTNYNTYR